MLCRIGDVIGLGLLSLEAFGIAAVKGLLWLWDEFGHDVLECVGAARVSKGWVAHAATRFPSRFLCRAFKASPSGWLGCLILFDSKSEMVA